MSLDIWSKFGLGPRPGRIFVATALMLALLLAACSSGSSSRSGNLTSVDEVLAAARDAVSSVVSYRMEWSVAGNQSDESSPDTGTATLTWAAPDRFHFRSESIEDGEAELFESIGSDGQVLFRNSDRDGAWKNANADGTEARGILAMAEIFSKPLDLVPDMDQAELVGKTAIDGLSVYHLRGISPPDDMSPDTAYDLYVNADDLLPRRLVSVIEISPEAPPGGELENGPTTMEITVNHLDFNAPVTITLPKIG